MSTANPNSRKELWEILPISGVERPLTYLAPASADSIQTGQLVKIPLGRRQILGIVLRRVESVDFPESRLKRFSLPLYPMPVVSAPLLKLAEWIRDYYAASHDSVWETILPKLVRKGVRAVEKRWIQLTAPLPDGWQSSFTRSPKQKHLLQWLSEQHQPVEEAILIEQGMASPAILKSLRDKGWIQTDQQQVYREAYAGLLDEGSEVISSTRPQLTEEQEAAWKTLEPSLSANRFSPFLLHGVTGSGKTEVYLKAIEKVLQEGGGVLFLVPEVALAPQTVYRLRHRLSLELNQPVVVWHSHLSEGERFDAWMAMLRGEARIVVGARSGLFAPIRNLRLIVVDEEHEPAYKQEETPRYHARDVAVYRAFLENAVCLLGSATPSLETFQNAQCGKYQTLTLRKRVDDRQLPSVILIDMKREKIAQKGPASLSRVLVDKLRDRLDAREQSILFLNRRGYSSSMFCPDCGHVVQCEHCSVAMTWHRRENRMKCHFCGHQARPPEKCPSCSSSQIKWRGHGTQKIEDLVQAAVPGARVVRIDTDSLRRKEELQRHLDEFRRGNIDILVGTQMIAKGLDFPNVTLVGVIEADLSLNMADFRAGERTFQLLVQVAGRAGRGDRSGEVIIQTYLPHSSPIQYARRQDFSGFLEEELTLRQQYGYPPFRHLIRHLFRGRNPDKLSYLAEQWAKHVQQKIGSAVELRGPVPAPVEKIEGLYRYQIWYLTTQTSKLTRELQKLRKEFPFPRDIHEVLDVDPMQLS
jgi:primosomal protein N' (replication factor Y)